MELPHLIEIVPWTNWKSNNLWNTRVLNNAAFGNGYLSGDGQPDGSVVNVCYDVLLDVGTWTLEVVARTATSGDPTISVTLDAISIGTISCQGSSANTIRTISGISISTIKNYELKFTGSGSSMDRRLEFITFKRTGDLP